MKKSLTVLSTFLLLFLFSAKPSFAQFHLRLGPLLGMNFNIGTGSDLQQTPTGIGILFGSQLDMSFTPTIGLLTQVQFYDSRSSGYSETGNFQLQTGVVPNGELTVDFSLAYFMIEPLLKLSIPRSGFYFLVGPAIGFNIQGSLDQKLVDQQGNTIYKGNSSLKNTLVRFELKGGAGYDIPLGGITTLTPQFSFGYGLTDVQSDFSARVMTFQLAAIVKFKLL